VHIKRYFKGDVDMEKSFIKAGFAKVDITPPLGVCMAGYFRRREAVGILDPLYASAVAVSDDQDDIKWILISCDLIGLDTEYANAARKLIGERLGLSAEQVMIHSTHTHTGPYVKRVEDREKAKHMGGQDDAYMEMLIRKIADTAQMASDNLKYCTMDIGYGKEESISFIRRFRMKDGSITTNPGRGNPDIVEPIGEIDPVVGVVRFKYLDCSGELLVVNFTLHPDMTSGSCYSADYPGHLRRAVQKQLPDCEVLYINGAAGDINHIDAMHPENNTVSGYEFAKKVGSILAAEVIKVYNRLKAPETDENNHNIRFGRKIVDVPLRKISDEEVEQAHKDIQSFYAGTWSVKGAGMASIAAISKAFQTVSIHKLGSFLPMEIQVVALDELAYVGLPGEVFSHIGRRIKEASPFANTFISSVTNGSHGYFPTKTAFQEGGYEAKNNPFTEELEDILVNNALELLKSLKK
jgi:neutral ceramidase